MQYTTSSLIVVLTKISLSAVSVFISLVAHMPPTQWVKLCQHPLGTSSWCSRGFSSASTSLLGEDSAVSLSDQALALPGLLVVALVARLPVVVTGLLSELAGLLTTAEAGLLPAGAVPGLLPTGAVPGLPEAGLLPTAPEAGLLPIIPDAGLLFVVPEAGLLPAVPEAGLLPGCDSLISSLA